MTGLDLTNNLIDVLLKFRTESIAISVDIQQMFHSFLVEESHRNYLRFFWHRDNDPADIMIEYCMKVYVFGNRPYPAIANYGLHKTADNSVKRFGEDVKDFVQNHFYVDDGLISLPSSDEAINLMKRTMTSLREDGNLRLDKVTSNSKEVMSAFPCDDFAKDLKDLKLESDDLPIQRTLGLSWDLDSDSCTYKVATVQKQYTRRGILSVVNNLYDPLGFVAPATIHEKLFYARSCLVNRTGIVLYQTDSVQSGIIGNHSWKNFKV